MRCMISYNCFVILPLHITGTTRERCWFTVARLETMPEELVRPRASRDWFAWEHSNNSNHRKLPNFMGNTFKNPSKLGFAMKDCWETSVKLLVYNGFGSSLPIQWCVGKLGTETPWRGEWWENICWNRSSLFSDNETSGGFQSFLSLVGGLEHFLFSHILGIIIPIDVHIFQRGGPTTNQHIMIKHPQVIKGSLWLLGPKKGCWNHPRTNDEPFAVHPCSGLWPWEHKKSLV